MSAQNYLSQSTNAQYFRDISSALTDVGIAYPVLVIDKNKLDANISCLKKSLARNGFDYRIVAKSLPSLPLLKHIMTATATGRLMCFHLPFIKHIVEQGVIHGDLPLENILLGKPMPVGAASDFYSWYARLSDQSKFCPQKQLHWLIDTEARLVQYEQIAREHNIVVSVSLEIDVGLHRGGFVLGDEFRACLQRIQKSPGLTLHGLMGYEAHITKIPKVLGGPRLAEYRAKNAYRKFVKVVESELGSTEQLCLNVGGSTTYPLYHESDCMNEVSVASALVKPSDFDVFTLSEHQPAAFIATPVLKVLEKPALPMASFLSFIMRKAGVLPKKSAYIYGGNWLAKPCWPEEASQVELFGHSSNQEMYSLKGDVSIHADDFFFFRPMQSESVFLQFGQIAVYEDGKITHWWPVFQYPKEVTANA